MDSNRDSTNDYIDLDKADLEKPKREGVEGETAPELVDIVDFEKPKNDQRTGFRLDGMAIAVGVLFFVVSLFILPRLVGAGIPATGSVVATTVSSEPYRNGNIVISPPVVATAIDANGCAAGTASLVSGSQDVYVVAEDSSVPSGTLVFARLYHNGRTVEDAPELIADRAYTNVCINFVFEPVNQSLEPGDYEAQFIVNGNPGPSVTFRVSEAGGAPTNDLVVVGLSALIGLGAMLVVPKLLRGLSWSNYGYGYDQPGEEQPPYADPETQNQGGLGILGNLWNHDDGPDPSDSNYSGGFWGFGGTSRRRHDHDSGGWNIFGGGSGGSSGGSSWSSSSRSGSSSSFRSRGSFGGSRSSGSSGRTNSPNIRSRGSFGGKK